MPELGIWVPEDAVESLAEYVVGLSGKVTAGPNLRPDDFEEARKDYLERFRQRVFGLQEPKEKAREKVSQRGYKEFLVSVNSSQNVVINRDNIGEVRERVGRVFLRCTETAPVGMTRLSVAHFLWAKDILHPREVEVLIQRLGLEGEIKDCAPIASGLGVQSSRVATLYHQAIHKVRFYPSNRRVLEPLYTR